MSILDGLETQQRAVYLKVRRRIVSLDAERMVLLANLEAAEMEAEAAQKAFRKAPTSEAEEQVADCGRLLETLGAQLIEKRRELEALEAELLANETTRAAAEHYFAELRKSEVTRQKGNRADRRSVGGGENITLKYRLKQSAIIDSGEFSPTYLPEVVLSGHISDADFQKRLAAGSTVQPADIAAVFVNIREEMQFLLSQGYSVSFGDMFVLKPGLRGTCLGEKAEPHQRRKFLPVVNVRMMPKFAADVRAQTRIGLSQKPKNGPEITRLVARAQANAPDTLYPGAMATVLGRNIAFNEDAEDEGLFFELKRSPYTVYPLEGDRFIGMIKPSQVMFMVPQGLPSGETGRLFIRKRLRNSQVLRSYYYANPVVIA